MQYHEAQRLLAQVREERPELYSGTRSSQYNPDEWAVHIGHATSEEEHLLLLPDDWEEFKKLHPAGHVPTNLLYTPDPRAKDFEHMPRYTTWLHRQLTRLPWPIKHGIWSKICFPFFEHVLTPGFAWWIRLAVKRKWNWLADLIVEISWRVPLYPIYIQQDMMARDLAATLAAALPEIFQQQPGDDMLTIPVPGQPHSHVHVLTMRPGDPTDEIQRKMSDLVDEYHQEHPPES